MKLVTISCFGIFVVLTPLHCRCNAFGSACPEIITRKEWNSRNVTTLEPSLRPSPYVIIHHSAGKECFDLEECYSRVRGIQDKHMDGRNWSDIGYNFLIGSDGRIYEGRGWGKIGAHARGWNTNSVGICFMGMFTEHPPTDAALKAALDLIGCGVSFGEISSDYKLIGHRQVGDTVCPGRTLYDVIRNWTHWAPRSGEIENIVALR